MKLITLLATAGCMVGAAQAAPVIFPLDPNDSSQGTVTVDDSAFADAVVAFNQVPPAAAAPGLNDPNAVLGAPDYDAGVSGPDDTGAFSLGDNDTEGGFITVQFINNVLTGSGDSDFDLFVGEVGSVVETINVSISRDGTNFFSVGQLSGQDRAIDIDPFLISNGFSATDTFRFVRIDDVAGQPTNQGSNPGADIDFIAALSGNEIPVPAGVWLFGSAVAAFAARRRASK
jgi:hypothetical protein